MMLSLSRFCLKTLLEELVSEAIILAPEHLLDYNGCPSIEPYADRNKIAQVLMNFLNNATKYSSLGSTIRVECKLAVGQVHFSIADHGIGISKTDQLRLFERFYRVTDHQIILVSGVGIGLYLVAEILKLHGSVIKLSSELAKGSIFLLSLMH